MSKRTKLELSRYEVDALHIATRAKLRVHGIEMIDETPRAIDSLNEIGKWYAEFSHIDSLVRLYVRLNRITLGKQFNAVIPYTRRPKS